MRLLAVVLSVVAYATAADILVIVPIPSRSHVILFENLVTELGARGHQVTYVTPFALKGTAPNVTQIVLDHRYETPDGKPMDFLEIRHMTPLDNVVTLVEIGLTISEKILKDKSFQDFLKSKPHFDLLLSEAFLSEGLMAGVSKYFDVPIVGFATFMPSYWTNYMVGNIAPTSFIPDPLLAHPYGMIFQERLENFLFTLFAEFYQKNIYMPKQDALMRKYFGNNLPYVADVIRNTSVLLINDHFSTSFPRPSVPNMVGIAGVHIKKPKSLPKDLEQYLNESENGAILFSLGSIVNSSMLPPEKVDALLSSFADLKQNVLWKYEEELKDTPKNVKVAKWLPQSDILAHPNVKLFITHGGLLSTTEAIARGVPIVGIPIFGDQPMNMKQSVRQGVGLSLDFENLTKANVYEAINEVLTNPKYQEAAKARSARYHDRLVEPLDLAVYWIEYVIRYGGAHHLRSAVQDLSWYQSNQIDVMAVTLLACYIAYRIIKDVINTMINFYVGRRESVSVKKTN